MIGVKRTKELNSTTRVVGIIVQLDDGGWYTVTMFQPSRNPWVLRCVESTNSGKPKGDEIFLKKCIGKPNLQEGIDILVGIANGDEPIKDKLSFL